MVDHKKDREGDKDIVQGAMQHVREALRMLEAAGRAEGCEHLKMALDAVEDEALPRDFASEDLERMGSIRILERAMGSALSIFTALLVRHDLASFQEVGKIVDIYAAAVADSLPQEAVILGSWSRMLLDMDEKADGGGSLN